MSKTLEILVGHEHVGSDTRYAGRWCHFACIVDEKVIGNWGVYCAYLRKKRSHMAYQKFSAVDIGADLVAHALIRMNAHTQPYFISNGQKMEMEENGHLFRKTVSMMDSTLPYFEDTLRKKLEELRLKGMQ